jgi:3-dehydroquinate dehydratase I
VSSVQMGDVAIGRAPRIVGAVTTAAGLRRILRLRRPPFDIVEVRLDLIGAEDESWLDLSRRISRRLPVILTIRSAAEGGKWAGPEWTRENLYRSGMEQGAAIDVEINSRIMKRVAAAARRAGKVVIGSFHDFKKTSGEAVLRAIVRRGRERGADVVKIATHIRRAADVAVLSSVLRRERGRGPVCVIGMGPRGAESRINLPREGSCLAYGYVDRTAAPGQFSCRELAKRLGRASSRA